MAQIRDISKRTALYERLSKDDEQQGESNSILNQKQYLEEYAHRNGFVNIQHFTDDGYTGRNFNRPGFQEMLAEIENGKIGTVIVKDMSRFGRNYLQVGFYTEIMFPQKQVRFIAINNSVDSDKPQDNDFTPFLNIMNEWYAKDTSNKIKSIFLSRMNDGKRCSGSIPYGYNRLPGDKQTLVVDPVASKVVKHIFALAADGYNPPTIAKKLTEEEVLIPSAYTLQYHPEQCNRKSEWGCTRWNPTTVREMYSVVVRYKDDPRMITRFIEQMPDNTCAVLMLHSILPEDSQYYGTDPWNWSLVRFERFCEEIDKLRNADKLRVATLEQIANGKLGR